MLELRRKPPLAFPAKTPRLNRAHPLYNQAHFFNAAVARGKGMYDLVTETFVGGSTTLDGRDENGSYIYSNDGAGTGICSFSVVGTTFQWITWGCIFKLLGVGRQYVFACSNTNNLGIFLNGTGISFNITGGTQVTFTGINGHTYFAFANNATGTATKNRTFMLVDLTTGQVFQASNSSTGNIILSPISGLAPSGAFVGNARLYTMFASGSVLTPPAQNPAAHFFSIDAIMGGVIDPWSLWYA
jgi:hypothetical protein